MMHRFTLFGVAMALWLGAALSDAFDTWVAQTDLPPILTETSVEMRDRHGALLRVFAVEDGRVRLPVRLDQVDPDFVAMLIAYEDKRFYRHNGVDPIAALRAMGQAIWAGRVVSGGSTLTMQVARLIENSGTGRWAGKLRQIRVALALERRLDKDAILTLYLAHAPYGGALEGVRAGSLAWFGKEPARLSPAEAALLVALPQAPEARRPDRNPEAAQAARARVLNGITSAQVERPSDVPRAMRPLPRLAPHLTDHMRSVEPFAQRHDLTLDAGLQARLERLAARAVHGQPKGVSAAIIVAKYKSGEVLASVGSPAYAAHDQLPGFVDMTRALRSPGSTLKPFIYGLAFDHGLAHPATLIADVPTAFGRYAPQNFDGQFRGELTIREALQLSLNIPPVLLTKELGPARLMAMLRKGGAQPQVPGGTAGLAVALGGLGVTLQDLVQLYGGMANGGRVQRLAWRLESPLAPPASILSRGAAWQVAHVLASIPPPPGHGSKARDLAYKTGTSYGHRDAWAIGFDGDHVIGVWLGRPDGTPVPGAFGGDLAAPVLFEALGRLKARPTPLPAPPPEVLLVQTAALPLPLRRFRSKDAVFAKAPDAPALQFPPDGAVLQMAGDGVPIRLSAGTLPFTVLVNGTPAVTNLYRRDTFLPLTEQGFSRISVVDAKGRSASVQIRLQ